MALKRGAHPFFIAKAATAGDAVDALLRIFQQAACGLQPEHRSGRTASELLADLAQFRPKPILAPLNQA